MKKVLGSAIALGVFLLAAVLPWLYSGESNAGVAADNASAGPEPTTITKYNATFDLAADGELHVTERLKVEFPSYADRHGIFRFWDRYDSPDAHVRRLVQDVAVTLDGDQVPFEMLTEDHHRFDVAKIGDADVFVRPGVHTYVISYTLFGALEKGPDGGAQSSFYWDVIPSGWAQDIDKAHIVVNLPTTAIGVRCGIGLGANPPPCDGLTGEGTTTLDITSGALADHTPITVQVGQDLPTPDPGKSLPWTTKWDRVLGQDTGNLTVVVGLVLLAAALGFLAARRAREKPPQFPVLYAPPEGIGPAQGAYLHDEKISRTTYVASLLHAAEHGAIKLDKSGDKWTITDLKGVYGWQGLDVVSTSVAHLLGGAGSTFTADSSSVTGGLRLKTEIEAFDAGLKSWARESGNLVDIRFGTKLAWLVFLSLIGAVVLIFVNPFDVSLVAMIPAAFGVLGAGLLAAGASTKRTTQGREIWSKVGGFRRILATDSAVDRFDFSGREELYTAYIPWAVALGCADEWAAKYRTEMGAEPPVPSYFVSGYGTNSLLASTAVSSMVADFDSTVGGAISSYNATQTSSSSGGGGGGGFSGGGGGGGGGGGSW